MLDKVHEGTLKYNLEKSMNYFIKRPVYSQWQLKIRWNANLHNSFYKRFGFNVHELYNDYQATINTYINCGNSASHKEVCTKVEQWGPYRKNIYIHIVS